MRNLSKDFFNKVSTQLYVALSWYVILRAIVYIWHLDIAVR